jgi:hypothetical protein
MFAILADLTAVVHLAYILFVLIGQVLVLLGWFRGWGWTRQCLFRLLHIAAIALVVIEVWGEIDCPLTLLENYLRTLAGQSVYTSSFISYWVGWLIYYDAPVWVFTLLYTVFFTIVAVTYLAYPPHCVKNIDQEEYDDSKND